MCVDYLTRYMLDGNKESAFRVSIKGAEKYSELNNDSINGIDRANKLIDSIKGLDDNSILAAYNLVQYDGYYRAGINYDFHVQSEMNALQLWVIRTLVNRCIKFLGNKELDYYLVDNGISSRIIMYIN